MELIIKGKKSDNRRNLVRECEYHNACLFASNGRSFDSIPNKLKLPIPYSIKADIDSEGRDSLNEF